MTSLYSDASRVISEIQEEPLKLVKALDRLLRSHTLLDASDSKRHIDTYLWKRDDPANTIYGAVAKGLMHAIHTWKEENHERDADIITVWINYNSKLYDSNWQVARRVAAASKDCYAAYHRQVRGSDDVVLATGPIELWFHYFTDHTLLRKYRKLFPPTIHQFLTNFDPVFRPVTTTTMPMTTAIRAVTFYSLGENPQEDRVLARDGFDNHLYLSLADGNKPCVEKSVKRLFGLPEVGLRDCPLVQDQELQAIWIAWYSSFLRTILVLTPEDRRNAANLPITEPAFLRQSDRWRIVRDKLQRAVSRALAAEKRFAGQGLWKKTYHTMTTIRVCVPQTTADLGSIMVFSNTIIPPRLANIITSAVWPVFSYLRDVEDDTISRVNLLRHGTRSAVAAIMARNMSHQQGSSVIPWLAGGRARDVDVLKEYLSYLQQRMDLVATVSTMEFPPWGTAVYFFRDLILTFVTQYGLLDSLARSEHRDYNQVDFEVQIGQSGDLLAVTADASGQAAVSVEGIAKHDVLVKIPGGSSGMHAFFLIMENVIRNAAKYGDKDGSLVVKLRVQDDTDERYYRVRIWDNISHNIGEARRINRALRARLIERTGEIRRHSWGLAEMRLAAAYLINGSIECATGRITTSKKCVIEAVTDNPDKTIGYEFRIQRPTFLEVHRESQGTL